MRRREFLAACAVTSSGVLGSAREAFADTAPAPTVLRIATLYSAEAAGRGEEYGAIEPGRRANLLLFDADPLVDLKAIKGRKTVIKDGVIVDLAGLNG